MKSRIGERDPEKELKDAFSVFDSDGSGSIDRKELKRLMKKLGQALTEAELDAMMDEVDTDKDGVISFEEFKSMMVRCSHGSSCFVTCCCMSLLPPFFAHRVSPIPMFRCWNNRLRKSSSGFLCLPCIVKYGEIYFYAQINFLNYSKDAVSC
jgi:hypothetical protein